MTEMYWDQAPDGAEPEPSHSEPIIDELFDIDDVMLQYEIAPARRRLGGYGERPGVPIPSKGHDRKREEPPKIELVLYTSASSEKSRRALKAVEEILKRYDITQVKFTTCDLSEFPQNGDVDAVLFTPTLVKQGPGPRTSIIGNLERADVLCDLLDASGVDRRWDD